MAKSNLLHTAPPMDVEAALARLGANLKSARLRRNLTVAQIAEKIGTGQRAVADAERGKPTTAIATYVALLWAYGLLDQLEPLAAAATDDIGHALADRRVRARSRRRLDNDF